MRPLATIVLALGLLGSVLPGVGVAQKSSVRPGIRAHAQSPAVWIGTTRRAILGVHLIELSEGLRRHYGAPADRGVMVSRVEPDSPASRADVAVGDVILEIDGAPMTSSWALRTVLGEHRGGDRVGMVLVRDGRTAKRSVTLEERSAQVVDLAPLMGRDRQGGLVLLEPSGARRLVRSLQGQESQPPPEELERAVETAVRTLRDPRLPVTVRAEISERKRLEERIRTLERRLAEVEAELARRDGRSGPDAPDD